MTIWDSILEIKNLLKSVQADISLISVKLGNEIVIKFDQQIPEASFNIVFSNSSGIDTENLFISQLFKIKSIHSSQLNVEELNQLELYLPYALLPYYSKKYKKCYSISHFAQTLDGRIASFSGESKWIGNEENLIHAHRMRAICDAILVGSNTLVNDNPKLNVRLVSGSDPVKVIIGGDRIPDISYKALDKNTLMFCENNRKVNHEAERILLDKNPLYDTNSILEVLYNKGIGSVYIEGGSFTTSSFLCQRTIDQVQVHISPQIWGSGTSSFSFDGFGTMKQALKFSDSRFMPIGKDIMFIGSPIY